jgi:hypothetical protein
VTLAPPGDTQPHLQVGSYPRDILPDWRRKGSGVWEEESPPTRETCQRVLRCRMLPAMRHTLINASVRYTSEEGNRMDESSSASQPRQPDNSPIDGSTRRTFMRRFVGGLAIAVPAFGTLINVNATPAFAPDPCRSTYSRYQGHTCGPRNSCPVGSGTRCIGVWYKYSQLDGRFCGSYTVDEGPCDGG